MVKDMDAGDGLNKNKNTNARRQTKKMDTAKDNGKCNDEHKIKRSRRKVLKLGAWNIRSIKGKEYELVQEFERADLDILAVTETKKKGQGLMEMDNGHILIHSGINADKRAAEGVGCIVNKKHVKNIKAWECTSERIMKLQMQFDGKK